MYRMPLPTSGSEATTPQRAGLAVHGVCILADKIQLHAYAPVIEWFVVVVHLQHPLRPRANPYDPD